MQPLFEFIGNYWWLAFPLGGAALGVIGSISGWAEKSAKRRHKYRLEMLKAKSELQLAKAAPAPAMVAAAPEPDTSRSLAALLEDHDSVTARWLDYELDVAKLIAFPAMSDGRQPLTAAFLRAKKVADRMRPTSATAKLTREQLAEYTAAVTDYEVAFDLAERDARRIRDSSFSEVERKRLDKAQHMLKVAVDQSATPAERQLAYKRVRDELDGLLLLSDDAVAGLEKQVALELPAPRPPAA